MSIRQFNGRFFFRDRTIQLKIGGPVCEDGQQTVIAMDEETSSIRIIRCDLEAYNFQKLGEMVREQFSQIHPAEMPRPKAPSSTQHHSA
ncbi:hypothetical protein [Marinobacter confluentis]|uniref:Uncharacterized protein n=1 Tax=Marinobacter confluentis TaxID=1697557 RepID=A0A4Z1BEU5_9GAMM|nr:hypothetical protein [Marinobacter confluentis]TGN41194.1 hypothetical protein E5Q11_01175 [Marinobacter confluentis]